MASEIDSLPSYQPIELSFPLPRHPHMIFHTHLSLLEKCAIVHLTTTDLGESASSLAPLGSFVYALPNTTDSRNPISTPLITSGSSIDYATRLAKILARKWGIPVYVGCSMSFAGISSDEEMEGLTTAVDRITAARNRA